MSRGRLGAVASGLAALLLTLTSCASTADRYSPPTSPPTDEPSIDLARAKADAKIAACPVSGDQPARADGLPDLTLPCLGGGRSVRLAGLRGQPMLVNVWAQWCGPCRAEAPQLAEIAEASRGKVMIIGIDFADPQPGYAIEFAQLAGWRYPQLQDQDRKLNATLPFAGPPQTFLVSAEGKIVFRSNGQVHSTDQLRQALRDRLGVKV